MVSGEEMRMEIRKEEENRGMKKGRRRTTTQYLRGRRPREMVGKGRRGNEHEEENYEKGGQRDWE